MKDCIKIFCNDSKEHTTKTISFEKNEMIPFTIEENESYSKQKFVIYAKKNFVLMTVIKNTVKLEIIVITLKNTETQLITFVI